MQSLITIASLLFCVVFILAALCFAVVNATLQFGLDSEKKTKRRQEDKKNKDKISRRRTTEDANGVVDASDISKTVIES